MPTSVRLDPETEALLERLARRRSRTKSEVIREALRRLAEEPPTSAEADGPYHAIADLIGIAEEGPEDLARRHKRLFREKLSRRRG